MANRNTQGFGLIAQGNVGATDAAGGQGKYFIDSNYGVAMFQGSVVQSKAGYIADAEAARTRLTIGILNGIFYNDANTNKPIFQNHYVANTVPANSEDITAFVIDNPLQLFAVGVDGAVTAASYGLTMSMTQAVPAGSTSSGQSSKQLNVAANTSATANQFRLLRSAEDVENEDIAVANSTQIVCQNLNQYMQNSGSAGITWQ
jgi:hypothetical protein|tara:strand:+ start:116 stop:724 length:609 start_codon:yes stop_codon:yes gene_type:complete